MYSCCLSVQLNYKADYEKTKTQYTLVQDLPELKKAKANAELISDVSRHITVPTHEQILKQHRDLMAVPFIIAETHHSYFGQYWCHPQRSSLTSLEDLFSKLKIQCLGLNGFNLCILFHRKKQVQNIPLTINFLKINVNTVEIGSCLIAQP